MRRVQGNMVYECNIISSITQLAYDWSLPKNQSSALFGEWLSLVMSSDQSHILGFYGEESSTSLLYNIYADRLLGTSLISQTVSDHLYFQAPIYRLDIAAP